VAGGCLAFVASSSARVGGVVGGAGVSGIGDAKKDREDVGVEAGTVSGTRLHARLAKSKTGMRR